MVLAMPMEPSVPSWLWEPPRLMEVWSVRSPLMDRETVCDFDRFWVSGMSFFVLFVAEMVPAGEKLSVTL